MRRFSAHIADLPGEAANVLEVVGLPIDMQPYFTAADNLEFMTTGGRQFLFFGQDYGSKFVMQLPSGEVLSLVYDGRRLFVNSSLPRFLFCLCRIDAANQELQDDFKERAARLRKEFGVADPEALGSVGTYWSLILEQIDHELL